LPDIRTISLSMFRDPHRVQEMRAAGAVACLTKSAPAGDLIAAVRSAGCTPSAP
jgi:DNA-binding NarL/FixJ family response regulator